MARYILVIMVNMETRFNIAKNRLRLVLMIAKVFPLYQLASNVNQIKYNGMFMAVFSRSTTARLVRRMFGTVRNDLNRAMTARTKPLPSTEAEARILVNILIIILVESGLAGCILIMV